MPQEPPSSSPNDRQHLYRRRTENIRGFLDDQTLAERVCLWYWNCFYWKKNTLYTTKVYEHPNETTGFLKCQSAHAHSVNLPICVRTMQALVYFPRHMHL